MRIELDELAELLDHQICKYCGNMLQEGECPICHYTNIEAQQKAQNILPRDYIEDEYDRIKSCGSIDKYDSYGIDCF